MAERKQLLRRLLLLCLLWAGITASLVVAGEIVIHWSVITDFDHQATHWAVNQRSAPLNMSMKIITWLGSWVAVLAVGAVMVLLAAKRELPVPYVVIALLAWAGEYTAALVARNVVQRVRPPRALWLVPAHGWSFPSGHTASAVLISWVLLLLATFYLSRRQLVWAVWLLTPLLSLAVAFARLELGVHWATDVITSILFVTIWLVGVTFLFGEDIRRPRADQTGRHSGGPIPVPSSATQPASVPNSADGPLSSGSNSRSRSGGRAMTA